MMSEPGVCPFWAMPDYLEMEGNDGNSMEVGDEATDITQYFCHSDSFYRLSFTGYEEYTRTPGAMTGGQSETGGRARRD